MKKCNSYFLYCQFTTKNNAYLLENNQHRIKNVCFLLLPTQATVLHYFYQKHCRQYNKNYTVSRYQLEHT